ncbi:hypothetical protein [Spirulina sp. 06S082]|uniref:hypothetical protein n=1 Tax=Spirulina sp. 06S082 TaxID=3110248 RepID=UPI002B2100F7|nr:hypothetical protein [Spirulina sp. 06S082]MEA5467243.1 hypothetical protein [Spirulina sp. 06S082]
MTTQTTTESLFDRYCKNPRDPEVIKELLEAEDACGGDFGVGRYGDRPHYFRNLLRYGPKTADRIEEVQDFLRSQVQTDATIADAKAFLLEHFKTPRPEIQNILEAAIESDEKAVREEKTREAIALAKGGNRERVEKLKQQRKGSG